MKVNLLQFQSSFTLFSVAKVTLHSQISVSPFIIKTPLQLQNIILHHSSLIILNSSFIILHSSFLQFLTYKLFSLFTFTTKSYFNVILFEDLKILTKHTTSKYCMLLKIKLVLIICLLTIYSFYIHL